MSTRRPGPALQAALVVAAVAVAVAIPVGLKLASDDAVDPGATGPSSDRISLAGLQTGKPPKNGVLRGSTFTQNGKRRELAVPKGQRPVLLARIDGGYLVGTGDNNEALVRFVGDDGSTRGSWGVFHDGRSIAVSPDGKLAALVEGDGTPVVIQDGGATVVTLPRLVDADIPFYVVDVRGSDCRGGAGPSSCTVIARGTGYDGDIHTRTWTWRVSPGKRPVAADLGINEAEDVARNGYVTGTARIIEDGDGSCGGVADPAGKLLWKSCKHDLVSFSPDDAHVLGERSARYRWGEHLLTVFESRTGKKTLNLETDGEAVGIYQLEWEDSEHLLAVVADGFKETDNEADAPDIRWAVLRIGLDGSREYAVPPAVGDHSYTPLFVLPTT